MRYGKCFLCGKFTSLEQHHIFRCVGGASRAKSDRLGLTVDLCRGCHQESPESAHRDAGTDRRLKRYGQMKAMLEQGWDVDTFIQEFGRNYLDEDELATIRELNDRHFYDVCEDKPLTEEEMEQERDLSEGVSWTKDEPEKVTVRGQGFRVTVEVMPF